MDLADCVTLLGHCEWADALVWKAVAGYGREDAELRSKLHHVHTVQWAYLQIWRGEPVSPRELDSFPDLASLRAWARQYYRELPSYLSAVSGARITERVEFPWADRLVERFGKARPAMWAETVVQVAMHSGYHRGQGARRLRELGLQPPLSDFIAWIWMDRPRADW